MLLTGETGKTTTVTSDWTRRVTGGHATWMQEEVESSGEEGRREMKRVRKLRRSSSGLLH